MKTQLILIAFLLAAFRPCAAEILLNLALNSRPEPYLADWGHPVNGSMIITSIKNQPPVNAVKLKTSLLDQDGKLIGVSDLSSSPVYDIVDGANIFSIADALQLQYLRLAGSTQNSLQRTGRLASGQYSLTVEVYNVAGTALYAQQTRPFLITAYQLPVLMLPTNGAELDAHIAANIIIFRWTALVAFGAERPVYRVQVFEILPGQTPMQAFRGNQPLLDEEVAAGITQFIWRPQLPMTDAAAGWQFIWTIQSLDSHGNPVPALDQNTQGRSEPAVFRIVNHVREKQTDSVLTAPKPD